MNVYDPQRGGYAPPSAPQRSSFSRDFAMILTIVVLGVVVMLGGLRYLGAVGEWQGRGCGWKAAVMPFLHGSPDAFDVCVQP